MRGTIGIILLLLLIMSTAAVLLSPKVSKDGKIPLVWVSASVPDREEQVRVFNELHPEYRLSIDPGNTGITKIIVQCSANMGGDIIDFVSESNIQTFTEAGILMDLTPHADKMGFGLDTLADSVKPLVLAKELDENGNIVERQITYPLNVFHTYIIYNKNIFDQYGIPYPPEDLTWDEYIELAKKLTIMDEDSRVPRIFGAMGADYNTILWGMGGRVMNDDGTRCELDSDVAVKAMVFYHDLHFKNKVEPLPLVRSGITSAQGGNASDYNLLGNGQLAMAWGARWYLMMLRPYVRQQRELKERWMKENPGKKYTGPEPIRFGACMVPRFKGAPRFTRTGGRTAGINSKSQHRLEALEFLRYAAGKEYNMSMCEIADCKPPNKAYYKPELLYSKEFPEEKEVHDMCLKTIPYGRVTPRSPFVNNSVIDRIMNKTLQAVKIGENLTEEDIRVLCKSTADQINAEIKRNIERNPQLKKFYDKVVEQGGEPML
ncbi:MAG: extracellular solute-binding protein [Victivallales bacterium]|nr:extracellular solute-binding protein [Victivallales bacterium]